MTGLPMLPAGSGLGTGTVGTAATQKTFARLTGSHLARHPIPVEHMAENTSAWINSRAIVCDMKTGFLYVPKNATVFNTSPTGMRGMITIECSIVGYTLKKITEHTVFTPIYGKPTEDKYLIINFVTYL